MTSSRALAPVAQPRPSADAPPPRPSPDGLLVLAELPAAPGAPPLYIVSRATIGAIFGLGVLAGAGALGCRRCANRGCAHPYAEEASA